jgi:hypothetical protein
MRLLSEITVAYSHIDDLMRKAPGVDRKAVSEINIADFNILAGINDHGRSYRVANRPDGHITISEQTWSHIPRYEELGLAVPPARRVRGSLVFGSLNRPAALD